MATSAPATGLFGFDKEEPMVDNRYIHQIEQMPNFNNLALVDFSAVFSQAGISILSNATDASSVPAPLENVELPQRPLLVHSK